MYYQAWGFLPELVSEEKEKEVLKMGLVEFRQRLQQLREKKRVSRRVASELCGLHSDAFRRYECGESEPTLHALIAIADYFEVSIDFLVGKG